MLLGFDMTHQCNLSCSFCWKFIDKATFDGITEKQIENFCKYLGHVETPYIRVVGGEPLMHPNFAGVISRLQKTFVSKDFLIVTNGILLTDALVNIPNTKYVVTLYPQNEHIARKFRGRVSITKREYYDRNHDPNLSEERAKQAHGKCGYRQLRMIGDNLYDCCHAETLERIGRSPSVHVKVAKNCDAVLLAKDDLWQECVHCFVGDMFG